MGTNARDLQTFVENYGFTPMEAIVAATRDASHFMKMSDQIGTVEAGKLAEIIVVDGDPVSDITILQQMKRISYVLKGGAVVSESGKLLDIHEFSFERPVFAAAGQ